jgi:hypothetical protein
MIYQKSMSEEEYNKIPAIRSSHISKILKSPRHYQHSLNFKSDPTPAQEFGTKFHMAVLERERFLKTYKVMPDFGNQTFKANKEAKAAWLKDQPEGQEFITDKESTQIKEMVESLMLKESFKKLVSAPDMQTELAITAKLHGRDCKIRCDAVSISKKIIIDLKTTISARPEAFRYSVRDYGYDVQAAFYVLVAAAETKTDPKEWSHYTIAVEKEPPYENQVFGYTEEAITYGASEILRAFTILKDCEETKEWYGYPDIVMPLDRPGF